MTAFGYDVAVGRAARRRPDRRRLPHRAGGDQRRRRPTRRSISREAEGTNLISSVTPRISRNTLNHAFDPTAGSLQDLSVEVAGLGGDAVPQGRGARALVLHVPALEALRRLHLLVRRRGRLRRRATSGVDGDELPLFERYFPGGINSIRGFETRTLGPRQFRKNTRGAPYTSDADRRQLAAHRQQRDHLPARPGHRPEGRGVRRRRQRVRRRTRTHLIDEPRYAGGRRRCAGCRRSVRCGSSSAFPFNTKSGDQTQLILFSFGGPFQF